MLRRTIHQPLGWLALLSILGLLIWGGMTYWSVENVNERRIEKKTKILANMVERRLTMEQIQLELGTPESTLSANAAVERCSYFTVGRENLAEISEYSQALFYYDRDIITVVLLDDDGRIGSFVFFQT